MRNPNGYGCIVDLGKNRRNRYALRITDTYKSAQLSPDGRFKQKYKYLGYYPTKREASKALYEYNMRNTPTQYVDITFSEVWKIWCARNLTDSKTSRYGAYNSAYKKCSNLYNIKMTDIRLNDLQSVIDNNAGASKSALYNIKIVMNFIFTWSLQNDVINKNYVDFVEINNYKEVNNHKAFKTDEIQSLWNNKFEYMIVLMYIYTGCRPSELTNLSKSDVHLNENYFYIKESKTRAGVRIVPIAKKIKPFFEYFMAQNNKKLLPLSYTDLREYFSNNLPVHTPHDTRSTFVSLMTAAGVQEVIIQKIVGHAGGNVTRDVYTQLELAPLLEAVNKI